MFSWILQRKYSFPCLVTIIFCALLATSASHSLAAEYFISLQGNDANDGSKTSNAFATLQKGVDSLKPGDTLTIAPGEYFQHVRKDSLGSADALTTIRAAIDGTVLLRGDVAAPAFKKVKGQDFVFVADFKAPESGVQAVIEQDTRTIFEVMPNVAELAYGPGRFYYDKEAGKLYISTSDWRPVDNHHYSVAITPEHGFILIKPTRVLIQGIAATGFIAGFMQPRTQDRIDDASLSMWGIFLNESKDCVIRKCAAYLNACGIGINSHVQTKLQLGGNLIDQCTAWSNDTAFTNGDVGGISIFAADHDEIRNCVSYLNGGYGLNFYGGGQWAQLPENASRIVGSLAWGNGKADVKIKTGVDDLHTTEHTVALRPTNDYDPSFCLVSSAHIKAGNTFDPNSIALDLEKDLDLQAEFTDPANYDYRLQATSRFRNSGPNGGDRGPFAYQENIYFVSNQGDDKADGLSVKHAWQTLSQAISQLKAGDTLYLLPGNYQWPREITLKGSVDGPINIRGRGEQLVAVEGDVTLTKSSNVSFERLLFKGAVSVSQSQELAFKNSCFTAISQSLTAKNTTGLSARHCEFIGFSKAAIALTDCSLTHLAGNIFENRNGPAVQLDQADGILYSDYNAYGNTRKTWEIKGAIRNLESLAPAFERYASRFNMDEPSAKSAGSNINILLSAAGPFGNPAGFLRMQALSMEPKLAVRPTVHSTSATTANLEWLTTRPAACELAWGSTPACENTQQHVIENFGSFSLTGLTPGKTYYFRINALRMTPSALESIGYGSWPSDPYPAMAEGDVISFTTLKADAPPRNLYITMTGDDENDGSSPKKAWRTIDHAATQVNVGDTVNIAAGQYDERVRIRATGTVNAPITFQALPGQKVTLTGAGQKLNASFITSAKSHLKFDSLYFKDYSFWDSTTNAGIISASGIFNLYGGKDIKISRCFADGRGGYPAHFISVLETADVLVKNCVTMNNMSGAVNVWRSPNLRFENYVSVRPMISSMNINNAPDQKVTISNSILTDMFKKKAKLNISFMEVESIESIKLDNVAFFLREFPEDKRYIIALVNHEKHVVESSLTLPDLTRNFAANVLAVNPQFQSDQSDPNTYNIDAMLNPSTKPDVDFNDFFATNPQLVAKGIGLQRDAFKDAHFHSTVAAN